MIGEEVSLCSDIENKRTGKPFQCRCLVDFITALRQRINKMIKKYRKNKLINDLRNERTNEYPNGQIEE